MLVRGGGGFHCLTLSHKILSLRYLVSSAEAIITLYCADFTNTNEDVWGYFQLANTVIPGLHASSVWRDCETKVQSHTTTESAIFEFEQFCSCMSPLTSTSDIFYRNLLQLVGSAWLCLFIVSHDPPDYGHGIFVMLQSGAVQVEYF